jgi:hypothetical protein
MRSRNQRPKVVSAALLTLLGAGVGCRAADTCATSGTPCGGDPAGTWAMISACRDPASSAPQQLTNLGQPATAAREGAAPATSGDFCSGLTYGANGVTAFVFSYDTLSVISGTLAYTGNGVDRTSGSYQATVNTQGQATVDVAAACMTRFGSGLTCDGLAAGLATVAAIKLTKPITFCSDSPSEPHACDFYKSYDNIRCTDDGMGGCSCAYQVSFAGSFGGTWTARAGVLTHADRSQALPADADFCVDGSAGTMALWGRNGAPVFGEAGLHQLGLQRTP